MMADLLDDRDGATVGERRENGEHLEGPPPPVPVGGDVQLSLDVGKTLPNAARKVLEATVSLSAAEKPVDGLFRPDIEYPFLVRGEAGNVTTVYVKDPKSGRTKGVKLRQNIAVDSVRRADDAEVIRELFGALISLNAKAAGELLDALQADASEVLATA